MKEAIEKYFNVGTIQWMSFPPARVPLLDAVRKVCRDDFFSALEITHIEDPAQRDLVKGMLEQGHMRVGYGAQPRLLGPRLNPNSLDEEERRKAEAVLLDSLQEARYMGAGGIAFLAGKWEESTREQSYRQLLLTTEHVCECAAALNMKVELEVFDYNVDKAALIGPAPLAARFAADVRMKYSNFGLLVDLSHFPITFESPESVIRTCRPYITHLHFGNAVAKKGCTGYGDLHQRFGYPDSANDIPELLDFFRVLRQEGFFQAAAPLMLSMEVAPTADEDPDIVLANTKRCVRRAWSMLDD